MTHQIYRNQYAIVHRYMFFGERFVFEYELSIDRRFDPFFTLQFGGDCLVYKAIGLFGRSLSVELFPRY